MKTFEKGNWANGDTCALCKKATDSEVVLVPVVGTQDGNISEAVQVHTKCIQERYLFDKDMEILYAKSE